MIEDYMVSSLRPGIDYTGVTVVFFCHDGEGNFVFHKRSATCRDGWGTWDLGGGKLEFGEKPVEGCLREIREEYGCEGEITEILPPTSHVWDVNGEPSHWVVIPYVVRVPRGHVRMNDPESMTEIGWFPIDNPPAPLHPGVTAELVLYKSYLSKYT